MCKKGRIECWGNKLIEKEHLLHKLEDISFHPRTHIKSQAWKYVQCYDEVETGSLGFAGIQNSFSGSVRAWEIR